MDFERIWKETFVTYFTVLFQRLPGESEENYNNPCEDCRPPGWESKLVPPKSTYSCQHSGCFMLRPLYPPGKNLLGRWLGGARTGVCAVRSFVTDHCAQLTLYHTGFHLNAGAISRSKIFQQYSPVLPRVRIFMYLFPFTFFFTFANSPLKYTA
jgi:hypothetical protein